MAKQRLGSWQQWVLSLADTHEVVAYSQIRPRGRAGRYSAGYDRSFRALGAMPGYQVGGFGPRGGLAIRRVG